MECCKNHKFMLCLYLLSNVTNRVNVVEGRNSTEGTHPHVETLLSASKSLIKAIIMASSSGESLLRRFDCGSETEGMSLS